jgi:hypothetical protein
LRPDSVTGCVIVFGLVRVIGFGEAARKGEEECDKAGLPSRANCRIAPRLVTQPHWLSSRKQTLRRRGLSTIMGG